MAIASVLCLLSPMLTSTASAATVPPAYHTPVVIVHGYGGCSNVGNTMAGPISEQYYTGTAATDIHPIAYYGCDVNGESIEGLGPLNSPDCISADPTVQANCPAFLRSPDTDAVNTDMRRFSYELAWYLYNIFGASKPVALVGHSMGGLIITYALQQIAAHNPAYPTALAVQTVVTISTPFAGYNIGSTTLQARQVQASGTDSLISSIMAAGAVQVYTPGKYTFWSAEGSSAGCDIIPASSSLVLPRETTTIDYTTPCYAHNDYVWDAFKAANATGKLNGSAFTAGYHSLDYMHYVINYQEAVYNH